MAKIKKMNCDAVNCVGHLKSDMDNLRSWLLQLFSNDIDIENDRVQELIVGATNTITSVTGYLNMIKKTLKDYDNTDKK